MQKEIVEKILNETEVGYDLISQKFSQTRKHFWRGLEFLADYVKENDKVLDWGCGNGRLLELLTGKDFEYQGVDVSQKLLDFAKQKYQGEKISFAKINNFAKSELSSVPELSSEKKVSLLEADSFDNIFSIAVFHHFPSASYRQEIAEQFFRLTKKDGKVIITVWNLWQRRYFKNILQNWVSKILGKSKLDWNDCEISFTDNQGQKFQRFHHAFTKRELRKFFQKVGFEIEKCEIVNNRNILLVGRK